MGARVDPLDSSRYPDLYQDAVVFVARVSGGPLETLTALLSTTAEVCKVSLWSQVPSLSILTTSRTALHLLELNYDMPYGRVSVAPYRGSAVGTDPDAGVVFTETMLFVRPAAPATDGFDVELRERLRGLRLLHERAQELINNPAIIRPS